MPVSTSTRSSCRVFSPIRSRFSAGRSNTSCRHSRYVSRMTGNEPYRRATWSRPCAFRRCCQRGVRWPGRRRGMSSARPAFSRNREPKSAVTLSSPITSSSISVGSTISSSIGGGRVRVREVDRDPVVGPERLHLETERIAQAGRRSPSPTARARAHRTASGCRHASRRSRRGSVRRRRSGRRARLRSRPAGRSGTSSGSAPLARRASARSSAARSPSPRAVRPTRETPCRSPRRARTACPGPLPSRTESPPGTPGAGETSTRSRVISSIRQVEAPSMNVWPARAS